MKRKHDDQSTNGKRLKVIHNENVEQMQATPPETARSVFPHVVKQTRHKHEDEHDVACEHEDLVVHFERLRVAKRKYEDSEVNSSCKHRREGSLPQDVLPAEELWSHKDFDWIEHRGRTAYIGTSHDSTRRGPVTSLSVCWDTRRAGTNKG
jgi:hypothetical protein